ncbi:hypothetical protein E2C01_071121 [Portunus trituberculatus]|uniref:Uncharacterized protein n=1 Tax=Portunus trituberculatus TaxID=210409 RepID=A0A5B7I5F1_PORTR|nr:hypothetical protein [Portunus trituberculatus]
MPARLICGQEMRLPIDLATGRPPGEQLPSEVPDYVNEVQKRMLTTQDTLAANLQIVGQVMWGHYEKRMCGTQNAVGDLVWLYNPRRTQERVPKLQSPWE